MDTSYIDNLISALRAETEKNSISPDRVGSIFRHAIDLLSHHAGDQVTHIPDNKILALNSITTDYLTVLKGMTVAELVIQEYKSVGGVLVLSRANGEVDYVNWDSDSDNGNPIYIVTTKDWKRKPQFVAGDIVRCSRWDSTTNKLVNYIGSVWMKTGDILYIEILDGNGIPQVGDNLVQFGSTTDTSRQGLIIISTEEGKPNITLYDGLNSADVNMLDKMTARLGNLNGIVKDGKELSGYGLWTNNLFIEGQAKDAFESLIDGVFAEYKQEIGHQFDVTNQGLSSIQKSVTSLQTGGGRNLLLKTNQGTTNWSCITNSQNPPTISDADGGGVAFDYINENTATSWEMYAFGIRPELIKQGHTYTLTVDVLEMSTSSGIVFHCQIANPDASGQLIPDTPADKAINTDETWTKLTFTFTATASGNKDGGQRVRLFVPQGKFGILSYIEFRNLKLEEGNVATAYTAAPEDYADTVAEQAKETAIQQTKDEINISAYAQKTDVDGAIKIAKTEIIATTDGITQSVSNLQTDVNGQISGLQSEIQQTASNISLKVKEVVGVNALNRAENTQEPKEITSFSNIENQTVNLYQVSGLSAGDKVSLSFIIRVRGIAFNGEKSWLMMQLDNSFSFKAWATRKLTASTFKDIAEDTDKYKTVRITIDDVDAITIPDGITPDIVGNIVLRLDHISATSENASIEIKELMLEIGDKCNNYTDRTLNTEKAMLHALLATGVDIEKGLIKATADNFKVYNNRGVVTMEVDGAGNLTANAVLVRNMDPETKDATPYLARINLNTGFFEQFYPLPKNNGNDNISFQMGWDEMSQSLFRFYKKDGSMAWKAGAEAYLIDTTESTETVISPVDLYKCSSATEADARNEIKTMLSLATTRLYKKTVQSNGSVSVTYYSDASCSITASGFYTDGGLPEMAFSELGESSTVCRRLYTITDGSMGLAQFVSWDIHNGFDDNINKV